MPPSAASHWAQQLVDVCFTDPVLLMPSDVWISTQAKITKARRVRVHADVHERTDLMHLIALAGYTNTGVLGGCPLKVRWRTQHFNFCSEQTHLQSHTAPRLPTCNTASHNASFYLHSASAQIMIWPLVDGSSKLIRGFPPSILESTQYANFKYDITLACQIIFELLLHSFKYIEPKFGY